MSSVAALPPDAIVRLAKLLGMLGSDHVGERAAAGLKATELLRAHGTTWTDLIEQLNAPAQRQPKRHTQKSPWRIAAEACLSSHDSDTPGPTLTAWEFGFVTDILERGWTLSEKQEVVLRRVCEKMDVEFCE